MRSGLFIAVLLAVVPAASASAQQSHVDTRQQLVQIAIKFSAYYNERDAAGIASMFTKDAMSVSSGLNPVSAGSQAIGESFKTQFEAGFSHIDLAVDQVFTLGADAAVTVGKYRITGQGQSGAIKADGSWTEVGVREAGTWKIRLLTFAANPASTAVVSGPQVSSGGPGPEQNSEPAGAGSEVKKPTVVINIDKSKQKMTVFRDGVEAYQWPVSTGRGGFNSIRNLYGHIHE